MIISWWCPSKMSFSQFLTTKNTGYISFRPQGLTCFCLPYTRYLFSPRSSCFGLRGNFTFLMYCSATMLPKIVRKILKPNSAISRNFLRCRIEYFCYQILIFPFFSNNTFEVCYKHICVRFRGIAEESRNI